MITQYLFIMLPVLSGVVSFLAIFEFKIWKTRQINGLIGIVTIALMSNLFYYGYVDIAYVSALIGTCCLILRSLRG